MGFALSQRALASHTSILQYQVFGVILQQTWIVALWARLRAGRVRRGTLAVAMTAVLVSDAAIVNGFFVWPKLLSPALALMCLAVVINRRAETLRHPGIGPLVGALAAISLMAHGVGLFALVPVACLALLRAWPSCRATAAVAVAAAVVLGPWVAYQRFDDPPGTRLVIYHFANATPDTTSAGAAIVDAYRAAGVQGTVTVKKNNFIAMAGGRGVMTTYSLQYDHLVVGD